MPVYWVICAVALAAGWWDWRERRIPNWIFLAGLAAGFVLNDWTFAMKGLGLALAIHLPLYLLRATGGGDLKLMAALGALMGAECWLRFFIISAVLGGAVALGFVLTKGGAGTTWKRIVFIFNSLWNRQAPYAGRPDLDVGSGKGQTLPRGVVVAMAVPLWMALLGKW